MRYIYKITNLITNKSYVGQHKSSDSWDNYMGSGKYLKSSMKKYGRRNFKKEVLKDNINCLTAANIFEKIYIRKEGTLIPNGYNLTRSGTVSDSQKGKFFQTNISKKYLCAQKEIKVL